MGRGRGRGVGGGGEGENRVQMRSGGFRKGLGDKCGKTCERGLVGLDTKLGAHSGVQHHWALHDVEHC